MQQGLAIVETSSYTTILPRTMWLPPSGTGRQTHKHTCTGTTSMYVTQTAPSNHPTPRPPHLPP
eukprot:9735966-Ditylum_brightwellii.AAC.1